MTNIFDLITTFLNAVTLIVAMVFLVSLVHRKRHNPAVRSLTMGAMFSLAMVFTMYDPISLGDAGIFDMRGLLIGTGVALLGPVVGLMTLVTGLGMRLGIGGPGLIPGFVGMFCAFGAGFIWRIIIKDLSWSTWFKSVVLGVMISSQALAILFAPASMQMDLLWALAPYIIVSNVLGALVLNALLRGELTFLLKAEESRKDANTDHLTGLLNRRGLDLVYPEMAAQGGTGRGWGLLYFDLDKFKEINDTHGHAVGDAVLRHVSEKVSDNLRSNDAFARLGGDEFAVVLNQIDADEAEIIAERCCKVIADSGFEYRGEMLKISISVGGIWMLDQIQIDRFMEEADKALYTAKSTGRNRVVFKTKIRKAPRISLGTTAQNLI